MFEVACQRHRVLASGGIAGQVNAFVIIQNLFAVGEMEIVTRKRRATTPRLSPPSSQVAIPLAAAAVTRLWGRFAACLFGFASASAGGMFLAGFMVTHMLTKAGNASQSRVLGRGYTFVPAKNWLKPGTMWRWHCPPGAQRCARFSAQNRRQNRRRFTCPARQARNMGRFAAGQNGVCRTGKATTGQVTL